MIEAMGLTKHFDDFVAVDDVDLKVEPGQVLSLLGPNGAGKTTTVRMLAAILKPTAGSARIGGLDVVREADDVRASVGVLTEQHGLYLRMRAREYLEFFGQMYSLEHEVSKRRAIQLMERFGLGEDMNRRLGEYSKGMRQKLALVRSMLHDPSVLLLDEPTSAMDPHSAKTVRDAIVELRGDGRTVLICTHNLPEAEMLADRIAIIRRGQIVALGSALELKAQLLGPPLMELRVAGELNGVVNEMTDLVNVETHGNNWVRFVVDDPAVTNPRLLHRLAGLGVDVITLSEVPQSLEDVYLQVVDADADGEPKSA